VLRVSGGRGARRMVGIVIQKPFFYWAKLRPTVHRLTLQDKFKIRSMEMSLSAVLLLSRGGGGNVVFTH